MPVRPALGRTGKRLRPHSHQHPVNLVTVIRQHQLHFGVVAGIWYGCGTDTANLL